MTMITGGCGCSAGSCSCASTCCDGNDPLVPEAIINAPAQPALRHRIGTHASFFESMLAWLVVPPEQAAHCEAFPSIEESRNAFDKLRETLPEFTTELEDFVLANTVAPFWLQQLIEATKRFGLDQNAIVVAQHALGRLLEEHDDAEVRELALGLLGKTTGDNSIEILEDEAGTASWPLRALTSRELDDPTIALLDSWAMVGDVLTFYQDRIANEGYLRTATEQRSVEELARLVGYRPRPGVAASVDLAFTLEREVQTTIPAGTRAQSLPAPGKLPQTFETSRPLVARAAWNALRPLQSRFLKPRIIDEQLIVYLAGTANNLRVNDVVYMPPAEDEIDEENNNPKGLAALGLFRVARADVLADISKTRVHLRRYTFATMADNLKLIPEFKDDEDKFVGEIMSSFSDEATDARYVGERELLDLIQNDRVLRDSVRRAIEEAGAARRSKTQLYAFRASSPLFGHNAPAKRFLGTDDANKPIDVDWPLPEAQEGNKIVYLDAVNERVQPDGYIVIDQATPIEAPPENAGDFDLKKILANLDKTTDEDEQPPIELLAKTRTFLKNNPAKSPNSVERFWLTTLETATEVLPDLPLLDEAIIKYSLFNLLLNAKGVGEDDDVVGQREEFELRVEELVEEDEAIADAIEDLDQKASDADIPSKIEETLAVHEIDTVRTYSRDAYGLAKQTLELVLKSDWFQWGVLSVPFLAPLRSVVTHHESEELRIARTPLERLGGIPLSDEEGADKAPVIDLEGLIFDLEPGRLLIVEGEDYFAPGALRTERVTIAAIRHDLVDVSTHVTLTDPLEYNYRRDRTIIYANVARATQGESRREVLGSGDASKPSQRFTLRHQPLTHVPAATATGAASTLTVRVQNFAWPEVDHRALLGPRDRNITTQTDEQGRTIVFGGDGWQGARFPTGIENIVAEYRSGQGADGNVDPHKATNLVTRPFGVQKVTNPLAASGGADPDDIESTRLRAPLAVEALDRLLSLDDYRSFALNFAGIAKAEVTRVGDQGVFAHWRIRTVVAGLEPKSLDPASELMLRLTQAMQRLGDPSLELELVPAKLQRLTIKAKLSVAPGYAFVDIEPLVRAHLITQLGYAKRDIGRAIPPSRIAALMQAVAGVGFVDLDELAISETDFDDDPLVFDPSDTIIVPDADTILYVDPTHPETLVLEELTP